MSPRPPKPTDEELALLEALPAEDLEALRALSPDELAELAALAGEVAAAAHEHEPEPAPSVPELVRCRWVSPDPSFTHRAGGSVLLYGDEIYVTAEQADDPRTPAIPWDDAWVPDPTIDAQCRHAAGLDNQQEG